MTSHEEDDILAKRQKHLQKEGALQPNLLQTEMQKEKTVSPDSDYIVIDSSDDEDVIPEKTAPAAKPAAPPAQWAPIPLRPINYGRKSVSIEKELPPPVAPIAPKEIQIEEEQEEEVAEEEMIKEEEIIELSSTTEEEEEEEEEFATARRVEQDVILLGHGSSDDELVRKQQQRKRARSPPPPPQAKTTLPSTTTTRPAPPPSFSAGASGSRFNSSQQPHSNGATANGTTRPPRSTVLDTPYEFSNREAATDFRRKFTSATGVRVSHREFPRINQSAVDKRAKQIFFEMSQTKQQAVQKSQVAWTAAALKWREKNKPSEAEIKRRAQQDLLRTSEAARRRANITPMAHSARAARAEGAQTRNRNGSSSAIADKDDPPPRRPAANAPELERRSYYRNIAQRKVAHASSFAQVLKLLGVPCDDPSQVKYSYRIAVRMFHPDSNSKEKVWNTPEEKVQAEEVMKIINERKERDY
jgi:hypothetical protein